MLLNALVLAPAFAASPAWGSTHGLCFAGLAGVFAFVEAASASGLDISTGPASRGPAATGLALLLLLLVALVTAADAVSTLGLVAGAIAMASGIALRRAAMLALGDAFVSEVRPLAPRDRIRHGPYAWLQHPSEIGLLVLAGGATLVLGSAVAAILGAVTLLPIVLVRMRSESRALAG